MSRTKAIRTLRIGIRGEDRQNELGRRIAMIWPTLDDNFKDRILADLAPTDRLSLFYWITRGQKHI